jgi:hypothetical protein
MPNLSRRIFLRNASIGVVATGVAAAGGASLLTGSSGALVAPLALTSPDTPLLDGSGVVAHVVDARSGTIAIYVGTKQINYTDQALAQALLKAAQ